MPVTKPTLLGRWAQKTDGTLAVAPTEPNEGKKDVGFTGGTFLIAEYLDWLLNAAYRWQAWVNDLATEDTAGGVLRFARSLAGLVLGGAGTEADASIRSDALPGAGTRRLLFRAQLGGGVYGRVFVTGDGRVEATINAKWTDGTSTWAQDATASSSTVALRLALGSDGARVHSFTPAGTTTWTDASFTALSVSLLGGVLTTSGNVVVGDDLTVADDVTITDDLSVLDLLTAARGVVNGLLSVGGALVVAGGSSLLNGTSATGAANAPGLTATGGSGGAPGVSATGSNGREAIAAQGGVLRTLNLPTSGSVFAPYNATKYAGAGASNGNYPLDSWQHVIGGNQSGLNVRALVAPTLGTWDSVRFGLTHDVDTTMGVGGQLWTGKTGWLLTGGTDATSTNPAPALTITNGHIQLLGAAPATATALRNTITPGLLCKAWVVVVVPSATGPCAISSSSGNIASVTYNTASKLFVITFAQAFSDANFIVIGMTSMPGDWINLQGYPFTTTTATMTLVAYNGTNGDYVAAPVLNGQVVRFLAYGNQP